MTACVKSPFSHRQTACCCAATHFLEFLTELHSITWDWVHLQQPTWVRNQMKKTAGGALKSLNGMTTPLLSFLSTMLLGDLS